MSEHAPAPLQASPRVGFIGWGPESSAVLEALRHNAPATAERAVALRSGGAEAAPPLAHTAHSVEALFREAAVIFAEGGQHALEGHLPTMRLAISDRHVVVLLGGDWALPKLLAHLPERKLVRCMLLSGAQGEQDTLAYHASAELGAADREVFLGLFGNLRLTVELQEEAEFEVLQGLADFAPAALATIIDALADGVVMLGLSRADALKFLASLLQSMTDRLLRGETTPAAIRERALEREVAAGGLIELEAAGIRGSIMRALRGALRPPQVRGRPHPDEDQR